MSPREPGTLTFRTSAAPAEARDWIEHQVQFSGITPVLGGGVHIDPEKPHLKPIDPVTPVRFSEIRSQLRYWWRALHVHEFASLAELRKRELHIFGTALSASGGKPSRVSGHVSAQPTVTPFPIFASVRGTNGLYNPRALPGCDALAYGAFPLQHKASQQAETENGVLHTLNGTVTLKLRLRADVEGDIHGALRAWLALGGIGGRTRRGFGAVTPVGSPPAKPSSLRLALTNARATGLEDVPGLGGAQSMQSPSHYSSPLDALKYGLGKLREFRQGVGIARAPGAGKPSYSYWPEPDTLRALFPGQAPTWTLNPVQKFPRAEFGLPLIFDFRPNHHPPSQPKSELTPVGATRWPSRLLIRPIPSGTGGAFKCLALALNVRRPAQAQVAGSLAAVDVTLTGSEAAAITPLTLTGKPVNADVVLAFLDFFSKP